MKLSRLILGALVCVLAACGGSDSDEGSSGSSLACISKDSDGRPGGCTLYAGWMYDEVMSMDLLCPAEKVEHLERAKRCPTGEGYVGYCKHTADEDHETSVYYYIYDDVDGEATAFMQDACERGEGTWIP